MSLPTLLAGAARVLMVALAVVLVYVFSARDRKSDSHEPRWAWRLLVLLAIAAAILHFDFAIPPPHLIMNPHDVMHYYLGSKYSPEVGYHNLYPCIVLANIENEGAASFQRVRRMDNYEFMDVADVVKQAHEYRASFSEDRWRAFKADVAAFHAYSPGERYWKRIVRDKGYNATPVWNMAARFISNHASVESPVGIRILVGLDIVLLCAALACVRRAFGTRTCLLSLVFFSTMFMMAYGHIRGAYLRLDWLCLLLMAVCMIRLDRYATAGTMVGYAAAARIFPLIFVFGLAAKTIWEFIQTRRLNPKHLRFFVALILVAAVLLGASVVADGGLDTWRAFLAKIRLHDSHLAAQRCGFRYLFLGTYANTGDLWNEFWASKTKCFGAHKALWWTIQAAVAARSLLRRAQTRGLRSRGIRIRARLLPHRPDLLLPLDALGGAIVLSAETRIARQRPRRCAALHRIHRRLRVQRLLATGTDHVLRPIVLAPGDVRLHDLRRPARIGRERTRPPIGALAPCARCPCDNAPPRTESSRPPRTPWQS